MIRINYNRSKNSQFLRLSYVTIERTVRVIFYEVRKAKIAKLQQERTRFFFFAIMTNKAKNKVRNTYNAHRAERLLHKIKMNKNEKENEIDSC